MIMKKTLLLLVLCVGYPALLWSAEPAPAKPAPASEGWENLFSDDLSNATFPEGVWTVKDGVLSATKDECIWTKKQYENFVLDLEFKNEPGTNSGVIVYASDMQNWIPNSVEVQILDDYSKEWANVGKNWKCASLFGHLPPTKQTVKKAGEWNHMIIQCKGKKITVTLNGELVTEADLSKWTSAKNNPDGSEIPGWLSKPLAEIATKGHIGLQGKHGAAAIHFRNIKIKKIG
jgi:hypothetical protein